jgi:hypothetical protein
MPNPVSMPGSIAANLHEGSRSEYLAQSSFRRSALPSLSRTRKTPGSISIALCWSEMDCGHGHGRITQCR